MNEGSQKSFRARWGILAALLRTLTMSLRNVFGLHIYGIYTRAMQLPSGPDPELAGFSFRMFDIGAQDALIAAATAPALEMRPGFIGNALGKGDVCEAVLAAGQVVAYNWSAFTPTEDEQGVFIDFGEDYRYCYKAFTLPQYRGNHLLRVYTPLRDRYCMEIRRRTHTIAFISIENRPSMQAATAIGYRRAGIAGYVRLGPLFLPFRGAGARAAGFRFFLPAKTTH